RRNVPAPRHGLEPPAGEPRERLAVAVRRDLVLLAVDDEHRTLEPFRQLAQSLLVAVHLAACACREGQPVALEPPADPVLDLLRRMRIAEAAADEPLDELRVLLGPVDAVHARPPAVERQPLREEVRED